MIHIKDNPEPTLFNVSDEGSSPAIEVFQRQLILRNCYWIKCGLLRWIWITQAKLWRQKDRKPGKNLPLSGQTRMAFLCWRITHFATTRRVLRIVFLVLIIVHGKPIQLTTAASRSLLTLNLVRNESLPYAVFSARDDQRRQSMDQDVFHFNFMCYSILSTTPYTATFPWQEDAWTMTPLSSERYTRVVSLSSGSICHYLTKTCFSREPVWNCSRWFDIRKRSPMQEFLITQ